jgi:PhzF family phenazine biosynthesis protein
VLGYLIDAFCDRRFEGNPAGVILDADGLNSQEKQKIASEIRASETAFLSKTPNANVRVEFFTPETEVDFCGHATVAAFYALARAGRIVVSADRDQTLTQETRAGVLPVAIALRDERIWVTMTQRAPRFAPAEVEPAELARALRIGVDELDDLYPIRRVNTGNWHLVAAVGSRSCLDTIRYDVERLSAILKPIEAATAHVFCAGGPRLFHARNFGPTVGIPEDPATGSAAGAFGAYLAKEGFLDDGIEEFRVIQGEAMGRPSRISVRIRSRERSVELVQVSGTAALVYQFQL